ncbi:hypothetical protein K438DRAFT_1811348 [Mycena galopus ATCC 62051]|nr:hypothetical protein K438DRAFT_1811348 [Mycena galopus ATCC 62051]
MAGPNPLNVAELVAHCIAHLHSPRDLKACALVSRLWVYPAQSRLFRAPNLTTMSPELPWWLFLDTLASSPHLIPFIRRLVVELIPEPIATLSRICTFQFTHLETVVVILYGAGLPAAAVTALQPLFGLPALRRVKLQCTVSDAGAFTHLWDRCSPGLREIALACNSDNFSATLRSLNPTTSLSTHSIALESLHMLSTQMLDYQLIMKENSSPFDISELRFLSIGWRARVPWLDFTPAVQNIQTLDIVVNGTIESLVLSSFPKLTSLRIRLLVWTPFYKSLSMVDKLLSGIGPSNVLQTIAIHPDGGVQQMDGVLCALFDSKLSSLPMPHLISVDLEIHRGYERVRPLFPQLNVMNMLRRTEGQDAWW